jgi:hypothetical protein
MKIFLATVALFLTAFLLHVVIWKIRLPRHQMRALMLVFGLVILLWAPVAALAAVSMPGFLHVGLFYVVCSLCYFIIYTTIEADSPTLSLMRFIARHESQGISTDLVKQFLARRPFVKARLTTLVQSGGIREQDGRYVISGSPSLFFRLILGFRKLYGPISRGG